MKSQSYPSGRYKNHTNIWIIHITKGIFSIWNSYHSYSMRIFFAMIYD